MIVTWVIILASYFPRYEYIDMNIMKEYAALHLSESHSLHQANQSLFEFSFENSRLSRNVYANIKWLFCYQICLMKWKGTDYFRIAMWSWMSYNRHGQNSWWTPTSRARVSRPPGGRSPRELLRPVPTARRMHYVRGVLGRFAYP